MPKFGSTEKSILIVALIIFIAMSYLLYDDSLLFPKTSNSKLQVIGDIALSSNDVRRKNFDTFSWLPASKKDPIYENDSIFTGDRSEAELRLHEGATIKVAPNSLITLNLKSGQMMLDLRYGNIDGELKPGTTLTVKSDGEEFTLENKNQTPTKTKTQFKKDLSGKIKLKLVTGRATLTNTKTKKQSLLTQDKQVEIAKNGQIEITPELTPELTPAKPLMPSPVVVVPVEKPKIEIRTPNPLSVPPSSLQQSISLEWTAQGPFKDYEISIAANNDFHHILSRDISLETTISFINSLPSGSYFWKVAGRDGEGQIIATSGTQMMIVQAPAPVPPLADKTPPPAPLLITKNIEFKVPPLDSPRNLASTAVPTMQWKPVEKIQSYQLHISRNSSFTEVEKYDVTKTQSVWKKYRPGKYYFRVVARGINGVVSEPSETGKIDISVGSIKLNPLESFTIIEAKVRPAKVKAQWTQVPFAQSYAIHLTQSDSFENSQVMKVPHHTGVITLPEPGTYKIRVQALDNQNEALTPFSNTETVSYTFRSPLPPPTLIEPFNEASIFLQSTQEPFIWLEWKKMNDTVSYDIEISDRRDFSGVLIKQNLEKNRFLIKEPLPLGTIYWRVRAHGKTEIENSDWSIPREFTLHSQKNETFAK